MRRAAGRSGKILVLMLLVVLFGTTFAGASAGDGSVRINGPDVGEEVAGDREEPAETEEADPGGETGSPQEDGSEEAADLGGAEGPDAEPVAPGAPEAEEDAAEEAAPEEPGEAEELPDPGDPDETLYDICYLMRHADRAYVDTADGIPFQAMVQPVTAARGVATYNAKKQKAFDVTEQNFIASMAYDVPVYDIDEDSRYYVAVPDVNPGSKTFGSYDVVLTYNNNNGETIPGYHYKDGVLYIPKSAVDDPQNEAELITPSPLAMQINYYFKGGVDADREGNADFSKKIPVQILNGREPERRTVTVDNLFDSCVTVPVGDVSEEDVHVMVNGMMLPLGGDAYDVRDGELTVYSPAAVLSGINIVIEKRRLSLSGLLRHFAGEVYADTTVTPDQMAYFRDEKGNYVTLNIDLDRLFVGWRGVYTGAKIQYSGSSMPGNTGSGAHNEGRIRALMALKGWSNSVNYLYGPYVAGNSQGGNNPQDIVGIWAIDSYTLGKNKAFSTSDTLTADMLVTNDVEGNGGETTRKTIYDWMRQYAGTLELNNGQVGNTQSASQGGNVNSNGIGGFTNFAFQFPKTVQGSGTNLVPAGNPGAGQVNEAITFASDEIDSSYFVAATCSHLDEAAATDGSGEATVYVSCLSIGEDYAVFSFVGADSHSQDGAAIYKFKTGTPVRVRKTSALPEISGDNRCYSLAGATYKLYGSKEDAQADRDAKAVLVCDETGESPVVSVPSGTYYLVETSPGRNYDITEEYRAASGGKKITVEGSSEVQVLETSDRPQTGSVELALTKYDGETGEPSPVAGGTLEGAQFLFAYYDGLYDSAEAAEASGEPLRTWVFQTDAQGRVRPAEEGCFMQGHIRYGGDPAGHELYRNSGSEIAFPAGTYVIREIKASEGYRLDETPYLAVIRGNGDDPEAGTDETVRTYAVSGGGEKTVPEQVMRSSLRFLKKDAVTGRPMANVAFVLRNTETGEAHVVVTDENGRFDTEAVAHLERTNENDAVLDSKTGEAVTDENGRIDAGKLSDRCGVWFGRNADGTASPVQDGEGALPYGHYTLTELRSEANEGRKLITDHPVVIRKDRETYDLGDLLDLEDIVIRTTASDEKTKVQEGYGGLGAYSDRAVIVDRVSCDNVERGTKYLLKGVLVDRSTGKPLMQGGRPVTAQKTFTAMSVSCVEELRFTVDTTVLAGTDTVVLEELYTEDGSKLLAEHQDLEDEDQTIHHPSLQTEASWDGGGHTAEPSGRTVIRDTVTYRNVLKGETYTVTGTLYRKSGDKLKDRSGKICTAETTFTAQDAEGIVELTFEFDASALAGETVVAFEELKYQGVVIGVHADLNDEAQSVRFTGSPSGSPETGDRGDLTGWLALLAGAVPAAILLWLIRTRRRKTE